MRITLKEVEVKQALLAYAASMGVSTTDSDVVFTKGRKGNGLTAEILIGETAEVSEASDSEEVEADTAPAQVDVAQAEVVDPFAS